MSRRLRFVPLAILAALLLGLAWRLATPVDTSVHSKLEGQPVPSFTLPAALPGKPGLASADLGRGQPTLLNVFASWCVPCQAEAGVLGELRRRGIHVEGIAVRDQPDALAAFLVRNGDPYERIGSDPQSRVQIDLGSSGVPESFIVDGRGVIRYQQIGPIEAADVPMILARVEQSR